MPTIKFWVDGIETTDQVLTGAQIAELARKEELSRSLTKWVEKVAGAAAALSGLIGILNGNRSFRHRWDFIAIALAGLALAVRFVTSGRPG